MRIRRFYFLILYVLSSFSSFAQIHEKEDFAVPEGFYFEPKKRPVRSFFSNFNFGLSIGYGATFYSQNLKDFNILQDTEQGPIIFTGDFAAGDSITGTSYWYNELKFADVKVDGNEFFVSSDSSELKYKSLSHSIPVTVSVHYDYRNYKIGAGFTLEYHIPRTFGPNQYEEKLGKIEPDFGSAFLMRYYGIIGARLFRYWDYLAGIDARVGVVKYNNDFNQSLMQKGVFVNVGIPIEKEFSEYFRAYVRPSFEIKNYSMAIPESNNVITTSGNAAMIEFGVFYRIPKLPKCFIKKCRTQVNHMHGEYNYRSRVHPFYKWQNPHHGQNYPVLIKYKGKNKKKLNPY